MAIEGRTARECFDGFERELKTFIPKVLTTVPFKIFIRDCEGDLKFPQGDDAISVPVETKLGTLYVYLRQQLSAEWIEEKDQYRLTTKRYWYRLCKNQDSQELIRWEYRKRDREINNSTCRNHVHIHGGGAFSLESNQKLPVSRLHLPTGWVTMEEILRFLIVDLGFSPLCGEEWPQILGASEARFYRDFGAKQRGKA